MEKQKENKKQKKKEEQAKENIKGNINMNKRRILSKKNILFVILMLSICILITVSIKSNVVNKVCVKCGILNTKEKLFFYAKDQTKNIFENIYEKKDQGKKCEYNVTEDFEKIYVQNNDILVEYNKASISNNFEKIKLKNQELNKVKTKENKLLNSIKEYYIQTKLNTKTIKEQVEEKDKNINNLLKEKEDIEYNKKSGENGENEETKENKNDKLKEKEERKRQEEKDKNLLKEKEKKIEEQKQNQEKEIYSESKKIFFPIIGKNIDKYEGISITEKDKSVVIKLGKKYKITDDIQQINSYESITISVDKITGVILEVEKKDIPYVEKTTKVNIYEAKDKLEKEILKEKLKKEVKANKKLKSKQKDENNINISYDKKTFNIELTMGYNKETNEVLKAYKVSGIYKIEETEEDKEKSKEKNNEEEKTKNIKEEIENISILLSVNDGQILQELDK